MCSTHLPIEWATLEINELTYGLPENITKIIEVYYENNRGISGVQEMHLVTHMPLYALKSKSSRCSPMHWSSLKQLPSHPSGAGQRGDAAMRVAEMHLCYARLTFADTAHSMPKRAPYACSLPLRRLLPTLPCAQLHQLNLRI